MFIRTERLFLRPAWPEDMDDLIEVLQDKDVLRAVATSHLPSSATEFGAYLDKRCDPMFPHFFMYVRTQNGPELVGGIGLGRYQGTLDSNDIEVGYWIAPKHRGHGYASEALRAILSQARAIGYTRLIACHFEDSSVSHHVLESVGFKDTGEQRCRPDNAGIMCPVRVYAVELDACVSTLSQNLGATAAMPSDTPTAA